MSKSGPEGPAMAVLRGKLAAAKAEARGEQGKSDIDPGDRIHKLGEDTTFFKRPQAEERIMAVLDAEPHPSKEPGEMPQEAKEALESNKVYSTNLPKRH